MIFDPELSFFWVIVDQHSGGRDASSIVFLVIRIETVRMELWEIVIPICDWFILIWSLGLVPRSVLRNKSQGPNFSPCD